MDILNLRLLTNSVGSLVTISSIATVVSATTKKCTQFAQDHRGVWIQACGKPVTTAVPYDPAVFLTLAVGFLTILGAVWYCRKAMQQKAERRQLQQTIAVEINVIRVQMANWRNLIDQNPINLGNLLEQEDHLFNLIEGLVPTISRLRQVGRLPADYLDSLNFLAEWMQTRQVVRQMLSAVLSIVVADLRWQELQNQIVQLQTPLATTAPVA